MERLVPANDLVSELQAYITEHVSSSSSPHNAHEALVLLVHAILARNGFKLVAIGETGPLIQEKLLPPEWNASRESWALRYRHSQSALTYIVKALSLGDQLLVHAVALELSSQVPPATLQLRVGEYIRDTALFPPSGSSSVAVDWSSVLVSERVPHLVQRVESGLYHHLMPPPHQDTQAQEDIRTRHAPQHEDIRTRHAPQPIRPRPHEQDPLRLGQGGRGPGGFGVGRGDMIGPGHPAYPPGGEGSGSLMGPRHPGFGPLVRDPYAPPSPAQGQGQGQGGAWPPFARPPGSRFDPYGPPGVSRPWPDNDELPPPGPPSSGDWEDMFM